MSEEYKAIIWDTKRHAYWRPEGKGYTQVIGEAGVFSLKYIAERNHVLSCRDLVPLPPPGDPCYWAGG